jgi:branched-chain amino acid transport system permease protein
MSQAATTRISGVAGKGLIARLAPFGLWLAGAVILIVLPLVFRSGTALTVMSLMGIAVIFALSYNMLLGQTGMLSFGHAVYYGLGAYFTVHAINAAIAAKLPMPLVLMPLVGGVAGLVFAMLLGWVSTKRSGTAFAMISLGLAELVGSSSLILRSFFGGEEGVSTNRTKLLRVFDWSFGPQIQVYYLIAAWCLICAVLMYALTCTPFGRMCNAVRDNPERAQFVGYNPQVVRYIAFCLSGFFAGIAGGLVAINFELANAALFSAVQSGNVLLATFIGGAGFFIGPILGAVLVTYLQNMLSDITEVWQLYFGLLFIAVVMYAPGGLAGLIMMHRPAWRAGSFWSLLPAYALLIVPVLLIAGGLALIVEMLAHWGLRSVEGSSMKTFGIVYDSKTWKPWTAAIVAVVVGGWLVRVIWPRVASQWDKAQAVAREKGLAA